MPRYVAFLRAINVGSGRTITMAVLRRAFEAHGFNEVATIGASGNVTFETPTKNPRALEKKIENALCEALGFLVPTFIRTKVEIEKIARYNPFRASKTGAAQVNIVFLSTPLDARSRQAVKALQTDSDEFRVLGREIYWLRRRKPGGYDFRTVPLARTLGQPFTIRGASTVRNVAAKLHATDASARSGDG